MAGSQTTMAHTWSLPAAAQNADALLIKALAQYPIQVSIISHLQISDVLALAKTAQDTNNILRINEVSARMNILSKALCPGQGLHIRKLMHCPCSTRGWEQKVGCGGAGFETVSKPCEDCGVNTCDECRVHVFYQEHVEDPGLQQRRWWAGYVLLKSRPVILYPPSDADAADAWDAPIADFKPRHDQGRLHAPLVMPVIADPEPIDRILDWNLGQGIIQPQGRTSTPFEGHKILHTLNHEVLERIDYLCPGCLEANQSRNNDGVCSCTLRQHFLDRWVCNGCYIIDKAERMEIARDVQRGANGVQYRPCQRCKKIGARDGYGKVCSWCQKEVRRVDDGEESPQPSRHEAASDSEDEYHDPILPPGELFPVRDRDGALAVLHSGKRIRGDKIGRALIERWDVSHRSSLPCICCRRGHEDDDGME